jgi:hypothetical protein
MSINWTPWSFPAQGGTAPGSSITVLPTSTAGQYALFISDPNGYIYTAAGNSQIGWGDWTWVAQGQAAPGSPVTAVPLANAVNEYALFIASPTGEVMTTAGGVQRGWRAWTSVAEGSTTPGQLITAAPINAELDQYALFITDPNGYTYWIAGDAKASWGDWTWIAEGQATPNSPITALPIAGTNQFILFTTSLTGEVVTTTGGVAGWTPWTSVAQGSTTPGQLIAAIALPGADEYGLFTTDPNGYTYWIAGNSKDSWGDWTWISQGQSAPKTPVTPVYLPANESGQLALFMTGADGAIYMSTQLSVSAWQPWTKIAGVVAKPGTPVSAVTMQPDPLMVFVANAQGEVCTASRSLGPPAAPTGLRVTNIVSKAGFLESSISVAWTDNSTDEASFLLSYTGVAHPPPQVSGDSGSVHLPADSTTATFPANGGLTYTINLAAQNAVGTSSADTVNVVVPYTPPPTQTVTVSMQKQPGDGNVTYLGKYPLLGDGSGILEKITIPASSQITAFNFFQPGTSSDQCYNPDAVVTINQGTSTTAAQLAAMYGTAEPVYSAAQSIPFVACILKSSVAVPVPTVVDIEITILPNS